MDVERTEMVEGELDTFISRRHAKRVKEEGRERPEEAAWAESSRKHEASVVERRLWDEVRYHKGMIRSHTANFEHILEGHRRGLERALAMLGVDDREEAA